VDADVATMTLLERLNDGGEVFLTHTTLDGQAVLRIAVGSPATTPAHVERVWTLLRESYDWLAADFATAAAEREAEREAQRAAEREAAERAASERAASDRAAAQLAEAQEEAADPEAAAGEPAEAGAAVLQGPAPS
jgi:aromatic-L-amino-acid decarboxylase